MGAITACTISPYGSRELVYKVACDSPHFSHPHIQSFLLTNSTHQVFHFIPARFESTLSLTNSPNMFSKASSLVVLLVASFSLGAQAIPETVESTLLPRQAGFASSSTSTSQFQSFASSWQSMSQSFAQTQSVFQARSSYEVAYQSVQTLYQSYLSAYNQYQACSLCGAGLAQSGFQTEFQSSTRQMYSSLQSILTTGQQIYGAQWQSQFASVFQNMSSFGSFCQTVASSLQLDLSAVLSGLNLNLDIFAQVGLDIGSILGGGSSGGLLGGGSSGGLLGGVLGSAGQNGGLIGGLLR
ncbi:hypothetical protein MJO28_000712 [Puccinia striiformis f. sp. tritici]|nr:uncharacterized protein Pst134EA_032398 [Puccinia striiformis f. sp. tritici]XP_047812913.1 hypothetical protein Pst134EA_000532 [Puccinia striiformis f. sp. tritici]KAI9601251.1 hypothetical protein H4Q26_001063 [Puccinia striiformis f. sp. tritici PST-130]KAH9444281.1 hypothetical protein Pst134EA_032398 [Puccinia striiformis f. sp. tritici]KAH9466672.1 hypothetical protein Pst134EB_001722 [Puccinia striiformis f. sp. tritici]KAH9473459.1 hypothetical protein Pst134EA_000532 [Puccinia str